MLRFLFCFLIPLLFVSFLSIIMFLCCFWINQFAKEKEEMKIWAQYLSIFLILYCDLSLEKDTNMIHKFKKQQTTSYQRIDIYSYYDYKTNSKDDMRLFHKGDYITFSTHINLHLYTCR